METTATLHANTRMIKQHLTNPTSVLRALLAACIMLLPWQTVYLLHVPVIDGVVWQGGVRSLYAIELLIWVTTIVFAYWYAKRAHRYLDQRTWSLTPDRFSLGLIALALGYLLVLSPWALVPALALQHTTRIMAAVIFGLMIMLGPLQKADVLKIFTASAIVPALLGLWQFFSQSSLSTTLLGLSLYQSELPGAAVIVSERIGRVLRAYGSFPHPNIFGGYMACALITAVGSIESLAKRDQLRRNILLAVIALISMALIASMSRAAWITALFGAVGISMLIRAATKRWKQSHGMRTAAAAMIALGSVIFMIMLFLPVITTRLAGSTTHEVRSYQERISAVADAQTITTLWPEIGVGAGNYTASLIYLFPHRAAWDYFPVHSVPLLLLAEVGYIGMLFIMMAVIFWLVFLASHSVHTRRRTGIGMAAALLTILPLLIFDHYLYTTTSGLLLLGLYSGITSRLFLQK